VLVLHAGGAPSVATVGTGNGAPTTSTPTSPAPGGVRRATGPVEQYGYGQLAVQVTVHGTHLTDVRVSGLSTAESYSQQLAQAVIPMLRNEVLNAQSANVSAISGATYTSEAYLGSLQSALDALHA
jgi:uncharacterized protein with FMN-binding domain